MKVNIGYQKEKLREEYYKEKGHYHLDNPKMYFNWLEEKIVKNLAIHDVVVPKGTLPKKESDCCGRCIDGLDTCIYDMEQE